MAQTAPALPTAPGQPAAPLGVIEALGMGWRLTMSDFWALWLPAFVLTLILMGASNFGIVAAVLVQPPLIAGLYWLVARKIDGAPVKIGDVFEGFQKRFGQSVLAMLPVSLASMVFGLVIAAVMLVTMFGAMVVAEASHSEEAAVVVVVLGIACGGVLLLAGVLAVIIFCMIFTFVLPAVWDHPESGWEAMRVSARLVWGHIAPVVGLTILLVLIGGAANILGLLACCIGVLFTGPLVMVWQTAAITYLYRSWTGRPLTQGA
jgi:uncharacterized membrane protein